MKVRYPAVPPLCQTISLSWTLNTCQPSATARFGAVVGRRTFSIAAIAGASGVWT